MLLVVSASLHRCESISKSMASLVAMLPDSREGNMARRRVEGVDAVSAEVLLTPFFQTSSGTQAGSC